MDRFHEKMMGFGWYREWSDNPASGLAHWAAFLLLAFIAFTGLRGSINSTDMVPCIAAFRHSLS